MQSVAGKHTNAFEFTTLPAYAAFILDNHLVDFVKEQLRLCYVYELPLLKFFESLPEEQIIASSSVSNTEFLRSFIENTAHNRILESQKKWKEDKLPGISKDQIKAEDITIISYIQKQAFLKFLPAYTSDSLEMIAIIKELDTYYLRTETITTNTFIGLLKERIQEQHHFNEKLTNTYPAIVYVFDLVENRQVYANRSMEEMLGFSLEDAQKQSLSEMLIHPEDEEALRSYREKFLSTSDGEIRSLEMRMKNRDGKYHWYRSYETVFKRSPDGSIRQKIGIAVDIDPEKKIAEQLARREEQLLEAQELAEVGSFVWDLTGQGNTSVTPQLHKIFEADVLGNLDEFMRRIHPGDRQRVQDAIQLAINETGRYECEYRYLGNKQEKILWSRGIITYKNGKAVNMQGTVMDVSNRNLMVSKLQRSEELYKQAQSLAHIGNWTADLNNLEITWSDELYAIHGMEPGTVINFALVSSFVHPDDRIPSARLIKAAAEKMQPYSFYYRIALKDGTIKTLHVRGEVVPDAKGQAQKMFGTVQDVTEQKAVEKQLRENQSFIQKIADAAPSIIASYNVKTGKYVFINQAIEKLLGYKPERILKEGISFFADVIHPEDIEGLMKENEEALKLANEAGAEKNEMIVEFRYRMKHRNGTYRWFHTYGTIFDRDEDNRVAHVLNISVDITDIIEADYILSRKNLELQQSNASLGEFAHLASHDLKEPLRKISIFADRLMSSQHDRLDSNGKLFLEKIIDFSNRMRTMIEDVLSISLIAGDKSFEQHSLQDILNDALSSLKSRIEEKNALIESDVLPSAHVIPSQFRQLFYNLLSNSLKFAKENERPHIRVSCEYLDRSSVESYGLPQAASYLSIKVADNGIGFEDHFNDRIFTIFQRLHNRSHYEGTGIGLALCKRIAEHHKGTIIASGKPGNGAVFNVILPV